MALQMTDAQRAVLAHVVLDPDAWLANAITSLGEEAAAQAMLQKVGRWQDTYDVEKAKPGYLPRAQRPNREPG